MLRNYYFKSDQGPVTQFTVISLSFVTKRNGSTCLGWPDFDQTLILCFWNQQQQQEQQQYQQQQQQELQEQQRRLQDKQQHPQQQDNFDRLWHN